MLSFVPSQLPAHFAGSSSDSDDSFSQDPQLARNKSYPSRRPSQPLVALPEKANSFFADTLRDKLLGRTTLTRSDSWLKKGANTELAVKTENIEKIEEIGAEEAKVVAGNPEMSGEPRGITKLSIIAMNGIAGMTGITGFAAAMSPESPKSGFKSLNSLKTQVDSTSTNPRSRINWNKVRDALPLIVEMGETQRAVEKEVAFTLLGSLAAGDFIGHREVMRRETHKYTVVAMEPCKYYLLHQADITALIQHHPDIALELQSALGHAMFDEDQGAAEKRARKRKLEFLKEIKNSYTISSERDKKQDKGLFSQLLLTVLRRKMDTVRGVSSARKSIRRLSAGASGLFPRRRSSSSIESQPGGVPSGPVRHGSGGSGGSGAGSAGGTRNNSVSFKNNKVIPVEGPGGLPVGAGAEGSFEGGGPIVFRAEADCLGDVTDINKNISNTDITAGSTGNSSSLMTGRTSRDITERRDEEKDNTGIGGSLSHINETPPMLSAIKYKKEPGNPLAEKRTSRTNVRETHRKLDNLHRMYSMPDVLPHMYRRTSSLISRKDQLFLNALHCSPSDATMEKKPLNPRAKKRVSGVWSNLLVEASKAPKTSDCRKKSKPIKIRKNHFSFSDLTNIPKEPVPPELFLQQGSGGADGGRILRCQSYPSDNSQFNIYHSRGQLDDFVLHLRY